jgi:dTDP-4-dehydrorhamnose reductase
MRILVAGRSGQLARSLLEAAFLARDIEVCALGRPSLDLLAPTSIPAALEATTPDLVVNAAAYTAVDAAERDAEAAFALNRDGAGALAAAAWERRCPIVHISTDYVFDGAKCEPYAEDDPPNPTSVYGRSKLAGEHAVAAANPHHVILRTAWLYSPWGRNFLLTILRLAKERPELRVVADQQGNPTYAAHLAAAILLLAPRLVAPAGEPVWGIFHAVGSGATTWYGFAAAIVAAGARLGGPRVPVVAIPHDAYPTPAKRPPNSRLACAKLARVFGIELPRWEEGLAACMGRLAGMAPGG